MQLPNFWIPIESCIIVLENYSNFIANNYINQDLQLDVKNIQIDAIYFNHLIINKKLLDARKTIVSILQKINRFSK